jgi:hypothetical protein
MKGTRIAVASGLTIALLAGGAVSFAGGTATTAHHHERAAHEGHERTDSATKRFAFRNKMRKLWEDHITWTRMFIVSSIADLPDASTAAGRLLRNQEDIGNAIAPYYGEEAGTALTDLLTDHILIAADLLNAAKAGDSDGVAEASERWDDNAVEIANFLAGANPDNWSADEMTAMMRDHLDLTLQEAVARLNADWDADVAAYDQIHRQILHMADMLSRGIIHQFPRRF